MPTMPNSWWKPSKTRRAAKANLRVEQLEDRLTPSTIPYLVKDIEAGSNGSNPQNLAAIGSTLYFTATDSANGNELWKSDGTVAGTVLVRTSTQG